MDSVDNYSNSLTQGAQNSQIHDAGRSWWSTALTMLNATIQATTVFLSNCPDLKSYRLGSYSSSAAGHSLLFVHMHDSNWRNVKP